MVEKNAKRNASTRLFVARLLIESVSTGLDSESRTERSALGAAPDIAVVDLGLHFLSKNLPGN